MSYFSSELISRWRTEISILDFLLHVMNRCRMKGYDDGRWGSLDAGNENAPTWGLFNDSLLQVEENTLAGSYLIMESVEPHKPAHHLGSKTAAWPPSAPEPIRLAHYNYTPIIRIII